MKVSRRFAIYGLILIVILLIKTPILTLFDLNSYSGSGGGRSLDNDGTFEFQWLSTPGLISYTSNDGYHLFNYSAWNEFRANDSSFDQSYRNSLSYFPGVENLGRWDNFTGYALSTDEQSVLVAYQYGETNTVYGYEMTEDHQHTPERRSFQKQLNAFDIGFINNNDTIVTGNKVGQFFSWSSLEIETLELNQAPRFQDPLNSTITKLSISPSANYIAYHSIYQDQRSVNIITTDFTPVTTYSINGDFDEFKWSKTETEELYYYSSFDTNDYSINKIQITGSSNTISTNDSVPYSTNLEDAFEGELAFDISADDSTFSLLRNDEIYVFSNNQIQGNSIDELISGKNYLYHYSEESTRVTDLAIDKTGEKLVFDTEIDVDDSSAANYTSEYKTIKIIDISNSEVLSDLILKYEIGNLEYLAVELYLLGFLGILSPLIIAVEGYYYRLRRKTRLKELELIIDQSDSQSLYPQDNPDEI